MLQHFFRICVGITLVFCSLSLFIFSVSFNTVTAGEPGSKKTDVVGYHPVGISIDKNGYVTVYGNDGNATQKIVVLASEDPGRY